jgi:neutral ceramidase
MFLAAGDDALLLISLDWIYVDGRWSRGVKAGAAKALGIGSDRVIITATHTHSGPGVFGSFVTKAQQEAAYLSVVSGQIISAAGPLAEAARDVRLFLGSTRVVGLGAHRNDPALPVDNELSVLTLGGSNGDALGRIIFYGCHPTLLGPENLHFSADWVGWGLAAVDQQMGGSSLFINGAAGDVSTRFVREGRNPQEMKRYAEMFREAVSGAESGPIPFSGNGIEVLTSRVPVRYRDLTGRQEAERALFSVEKEIDAARSRGMTPGEMRRLESIREGAIVSLFFVSAGGFEAVLGKREMTAAVTLVRVGSMGMILFPGEVMSNTAISLKADAKDPLVVCGYADDYFGYLSDAGGGYESSMALLSPDSIRAVIDAARRLAGGGA